MKQLSSVLSFVAGLLVLILVGITAAAVFARYVLGHPFQSTEELSGLLMIWIVFLAAICCEIDDEHLSIDMVVQRLSARSRYVVAIVVSAVSIGLLAVMGWLSWELTQSAGLKKTQILKISWFWIYFAVAVGSVGMALAIAARLWRMLRDCRLPARLPTSAHDLS